MSITVSSKLYTILAYQTHFCKISGIFNRIERFLLFVCRLLHKPFKQLLGFLKVASPSLNAYTTQADHDETGNLAIDFVKDFDHWVVVGYGENIGMLEVFGVKKMCLLVHVSSILFFFCE